MIKVGYFGDGVWACNALSRLMEDDDISVAFVTLRYGNPDPVLRQMAECENIPVVMHRNVNSDEYIDAIKCYGIDLIVSMSFDQIFRPKIINLPKLKAINCHAGKLPYYRGRNILNWALINDEKEFGITVHYIDEGIDTGDIILQRTYPITDDDDYGSLLTVAHKECASLLYDAVHLIKAGKAKRIKQRDIDAVGMYCGVRMEGDEILNWDSLSREVFNFVRAVSPPAPGALSFIGQREIRVNKVREVRGAGAYIGIPGQVVGKSKDGFYVKTRDTFVEVTEYVYEGRLKVGDRLKREKV